ncbi:hypothetical protein [Silvimonas iriomotensis]|uniref:Uncharacterized protein n=1 Tax=Silvimonas iriomotensis TaxID=449662 RepID=A0ABQ2PAP9_9NEIS|nr:hypothetical protein [Silvimonas iriomotensis]GGP22110.1 hypothetical protein GCM10010970_23600 [Silvimonas iriomotensis]
MTAFAPLVGEAGSEPKPIPASDEGLKHPVALQRAKLQRVVEQIDTNFKLVGPKNCSPSLLQDSLYAAAEIDIGEDVETRGAVCNWFQRSGLNVPSTCGRFEGNKSLSVKLDLISNGPMVANKPGNSGVECRESK